MGTNVNRREKLQEVLREHTIGTRGSSGCSTTYATGRILGTKFMSSLQPTTVLSYSVLCLSSLYLSLVTLLNPDTRGLLYEREGAGTSVRTIYRGDSARGGCGIHRTAWTASGWIVSATDMLCAPWCPCGLPP